MSLEREHSKRLEQSSSRLQAAEVSAAVEKLVSENHEQNVSPLFSKPEQLSSKMLGVRSTPLEADSLYIFFLLPLKRKYTEEK